MSIPRSVFYLMSLLAGLVVVLAAYALVGSSQLGGEDSALPTPAAPPGYTPFPDVAEAPSVATPSFECPDGVIDLRTSSVETSDQSSIEQYVASQRLLLSEMAAQSPLERAHAGVNLSSLLSEREIQSLLDQYGLKWGNLYWEATNGVHGAMAQGVGPQSFKELEDHLRANGEIGESDTVLGSRFFSVLPASLADLDKLQQDGAVLLVDVGRLDEYRSQLDKSPEGCVRFSVPDPIVFP